VQRWPQHQRVDLSFFVCLRGRQQRSDGNSSQRLRLHKGNKEQIPHGDFIWKYVNLFIYPPLMLSWRFLPFFSREEMFFSISLTFPCSDVRSKVRVIVCVHCKSRWGKFINHDIELYKMNWIECSVSTHTNTHTGDENAQRKLLACSTPFFIESFFVLRCERCKKKNPLHCKMKKKGGRFHSVKSNWAKEQKWTRRSEARNVFVQHAEPTCQQTPLCFLPGVGRSGTSLCCSASVARALGPRR